MDAESKTSVRRNSRWLRFSLATFLFVALCVGGIVAGYQAGYRSGYGSGQATKYDETQVAETYDTTSIIFPDLPEADRREAVSNLIDLIRTTLATDIWNDGTGNEIREFPGRPTLIITAPGGVHHQVRALFAQLDQLKSRNIGAEMIPLLQAMAAKGATQFSDLSIAAPKESQMAAAWLDKYFGQTVAGVAERWGTPRYHGACSDAAFPAWSLDQRIATWPRGNGLAYLALRILDDGRLHMVVGWRADS